MAVIHLVSPPRIFYRYWRMSFIDFVASQLGLWVTLFTSTEIGLAVSVGFSIVYTLLRLAFPRWIGLSHTETEQVQWSMPLTRMGAKDIDVPIDAFLVRFTDDLLFPNAERVKNSIVDSVKMHFEQASSLNDAKKENRNWNTYSSKRIIKMRKRRNIIPIGRDVTPLRYVVLDFAMMGFIDITGLLSLIELKMELRRYAGKELQFRFANMCDEVKERFDRSEWEFAKEGEPREEEADLLSSSLEMALFYQDGDGKFELTKEKTLEV